MNVGRFRRRSWCCPPTVWLLLVEEAIEADCCLVFRSLMMYLFFLVARGWWSCARPHKRFFFFALFSFAGVGVGVILCYSVAEFSNRDDMSRAVRELDDTFFADRRIRVEYVS